MGQLHPVGHHARILIQEPDFSSGAVGVKSGWIVLSIKRKQVMENHFNTSTTPTLYVQHFNVALTNFEKHVREERRFRRLSKARQVKKS
jgi:hypothetical protein